MKLICEQCGARYSIADEKVHGKVFKIRCKKCDNVIVVKGDVEGAPVVGPGAPLAGGEGAGSGGFAGSTSVTGSESFADAPATSWPEASASAGAVPLAATPSLPSWYVLLGQQQVGPLTPEQVDSYVRTGEATADTYVWREGFTDWLQLRALPEFATSLASAPPASSPDLGVSGLGSSGLSATEGGLSASTPDYAAAPSWGSPEAASGGGAYGYGGGGSAPFLSSAAAEPAGQYGLPGPAGGLFPGPEYGAPLAPPAGMDGPGKMVGARNENSVLFSLATLQNLALGASPAAAPEPVAQKPSSTGGRSGSGLIDIRSVAGPEPGQAAAVDVGFAAPPPAIPAMMVPVVTRRSTPAWLIGGIAVAGVAVIALLIVVVVLLTRPPAPPVVVAPPVASPAAGATSATPAGPTATATAKPPAAVTPGAEAPSATEEPARPDTTAGSDTKVAAASPRPRPVAATTPRPAPAPRPEPTPTPAPTPVAARPAPVAAPAPAKRGGSEVDDLLDAIEGGAKKPAPPRPAPAPVAAPAPTPAAAPAPASRPLSREDIAEVVRTNKGKVQACYERQPEPRLSGTLMVSFVIQRNGQVTSPAVRTPQFEGTPVGQCVLSAVRTFQFPEHTDPPVKINYPFILR